MVKIGEYIPRQRDIVWLPFSPTRGHEQGGHRPAVIVSSEKYNRTSGLALVCPITKQIKGYPFEVGVNVRNEKSVVLADQVRCIDWRARAVQYEKKMPPKSFAGVIQKIIMVLGEVMYE